MSDYLRCGKLRVMPSGTFSHEQFPKYPRTARRGERGPFVPARAAEDVTITPLGLRAHKHFPNWGAQRHAGPKWAIVNGPGPGYREASCPPGKLKVLRSSQLS